MLWKGCSWVHRQHLLPLERLGACEGPGVQVAAGQVRDRLPVTSSLCWKLRTAGLLCRSRGGRNGQAKQTVLEVKSSKGVGITTPNLCICFCCSQAMTESSQPWEVTGMTGPCWCDAVCGQGALTQHRGELSFCLCHSRQSCSRV